MATRRSVLGGLVLGLAGAAMPVRAFATELAKVRANGTMRVAVYKDFEPWSWRRDGVLVGIDVELAEALAKSIGVRASVVDFLADESVEDDLRNMIWRGPLIGSGPADVMLHVPADKAFAAQQDKVLIVSPYYREGFQMACTLDTDCEVAPPQFKGRKLSAELDSIPDFYLSGGFGGVLRGDVAHAMTGMAAIDAVKQGKADVVLATRAQIEHALVGSKDSVHVRKGPLPALPSPGWDVGIAVKEDGRDLADALTAAITKLRGDGTLDAIFARHGVSPKAPLAA